MVVRCARLRQHVIHQPRDQLHRDVLERQGRAVKQLQHELIGTDLVERHHRGMAERGIGLVGHAAEIGVGDLAADKRADHIDRDFPIGPAEESGDGFRRKLRPGFGHVEAAVAGEPGQHHVAETQGRGLPPGRNIPRQTALQRRRASAKPLISMILSNSHGANSRRHHRRSGRQRVARMTTRRWANGGPLHAPCPTALPETVMRAREAIHCGCLGTILDRFACAMTVKTRLRDPAARCARVVA